MEEFEWLATPSRGSTLHASVNERALCDRKKELARGRTGYLTRVGAKLKYCALCQHKIQNPPTRKPPSYRA